MKFTCTKDYLQKALKNVGNIAGRNPALPILKHVLIKVERGKLKISTTDLEVGITTWVTGKAEEEGATTIPLRQLMDFVSNLPSEHISLITQNSSLTIKCGSTNATFQGESAENFPLIPLVEDGKKVEVPVPELATAIDRVAYAAATDETRPELAGVFMQGENKKVTLAATDSYRLAEAIVETNHEVDNEFKVIIPLRAVQELRRNLEGEEKLVISITDEQIMTESQDTQLVSRLVEGNYPDYRQIIPDKSSTTASVMRQELLRAVKGASVFSVGEANSILLETAADSLRVAATTQEIGESNIEIPAEIHGQNVQVHFNPRFLGDALTALPGERINIGLTSPSVPTVMEPELDKGKTTALVMPIKT